MQQRVKILIFIPGLTSGGQERYISILCNNINTEQFDVSLYVINNTQSFYTITNPAIKVVDLGIKRVRNSFFKLYAIIKKEKPALVFSTGHHLNLFLAIAKMFYPRNVKLIARESTIVSVNNKMQQNNSLLDRLGKFFYKRIDLVICQSEAMQADLVANYNVRKEKTVVINNFVEDVPQGKVHDNIIQASKDERIFVTVARLSKEKGLERIIRGISQLPLPYHYYIFGEGTERAALETLIQKLNLQDKVTLYNETVNPFEKISRIDLFLMGSYYEGFPNVLLEAGIRGIPVAAFPSIGGSNEIIIPGFNGLVATTEAEFPALVEEALNYPFDSANIRANALEKYAVPSIIKKVETLFTTLANS